MPYKVKEFLVVMVYFMSRSTLKVPPGKTAISTRNGPFLAAAKGIKYSEAATENIFYLFLKSTLFEIVEQVTDHFFPGIGISIKRTDTDFPEAYCFCYHLNTDFLAK